MSEIQEYLSGLSQTLTKALEAAEPATPAAVVAPVQVAANDDLKKSVDALTAEVATLRAALTPPSEGVEGGAVMKMIATQSEELEGVKGVIDAILERGAVRKSVASQEDADDPEVKRKEAAQKAAGTLPGMWDSMLRSMKPTNGNGGGRPVIMR